MSTKMIWKKIAALLAAITIVVTDQSIVYAAEIYNIVEDESTIVNSGIDDDSDNINDNSSDMDVLEEDTIYEASTESEMDTAEEEGEKSTLIYEETWIPELMEERISGGDWIFTQKSLDEYTEIGRSGEFYYGLLTDELEREIYEALKGHLGVEQNKPLSFGTPLEFSLGEYDTKEDFSEEEAAEMCRERYETAFQNALDAFACDYAEADWILRSESELKVIYTGEKQENHVHWSVQGVWSLAYKYEPDEIEGFLQAIEDIQEEFETEDKNGYEKVRLIYEILTGETVQEEREESYGVYSNARAFQLLCDSMQINNILIPYSVKNKLFLWNYVTLNGEEWYTVSWEDTPENEEEYPYLYPVLTDADFMNREDNSGDVELLEDENRAQLLDANEPDRNTDGIDYEDSEEYLMYRASFISYEEYLSGLLDEDHEEASYWVYAGTIQEVLEKLDALSNETVDVNGGNPEIKNTGYVYVSTCISAELAENLEEEGIMPPKSFSGILFGVGDSRDDYEIPDYPILHVSADIDMVFVGSGLSDGTTIGFCEGSNATVTIITNENETDSSIILDANSVTGVYTLECSNDISEKMTMLNVSHIQDVTVSVTGDAANLTVVSESWKNELEIPDELRIPIIDGKEWNITLNIDSMTASEAGSNAVAAINTKAGYLIETAYYAITMSMTAGGITCYFSELLGGSVDISLAIPSSFATSYGTVKAVCYFDEKTEILSSKESSGKMTFPANYFNKTDSPVVYSLVLVSNLKYSITNTSSLMAAVTGTNSSSATSLSVPATVQYGGKRYKVTAISSSAFQGNTRLKSIIIGSNVTIIGTSSFFGCTALSSVTLGASVTTIGSKAFYKCTALTKVTIPNKVISIGTYAFFGCTKLSTLGLGTALTTIGSRAFYNCTALTKVTIPNKVTNISSYAFWGCTKLTTVTIGSAVKAIGVGAFGICTRLSSVTIGSSVTTIGGKAFYKCTALTKVTIPNKVESIGNAVFYGCVKLAAVTIGSSVITIGNSAFYRCTALTKVTIPNKVTKIGVNAFFGCTRLSVLTLGTALTTIDDKAFYKCTALTKVIIPNKVTTIGVNAFLGCTKLSTLMIGLSVTKIGNSAFYGCRALKTITIRTTKLTSASIGSNAFKAIYSKAKIKVPIDKFSSYKQILLARGVPTTATIYTVIFSDSDKVKIKSCRVVSYDADKGKMEIELKLNSTNKVEELNLMNSTFYILRMNSLGTSVLGRISATVSSSGSTMMLSGTMNATDEFCAAMMSKYALAIKVGNNYRQISENALYIENPELTATMTEPYNGYYEADGKVTSKKGLQGASADYMEDLGVQHVLLNLDLADMVSTTAKSGYVKYVYKGKTYYFQDMIALVQTMRYLNGWDNDNPYGWHRRNVTLVLLLSWKDDLSYLIHPSARKKGAAPYYTLNMKETKARETFEALFCYMGEKLGDNKKSRVCNWVLGNEVNCCQAWNYSGSLSLQDCVANYAEAFQLLYQGVRRTASTSRVFISLDHSWNAANSGHSGKSFLDAFASYMYKTAPQMQWNVDYHPYSQPLTRVDFWKDGSNTTNSFGTPYISMKNIKVLTDYLGTLEVKYGKATGSIRVILGEQGFTAVQGNSGAETQQAAALGYGYYIAAFNTRVDSYIIRSYLDDPVEMRTGLYMGLMSFSHKKKAAYEIYKYIDTDQSTTYMKKYLSTVGLSSWKQGISNFDESTLVTGDF